MKIPFLKRSSDSQSPTFRDSKLDSGKVLLHAHDPESDAKMGTLSYSPPNNDRGKIKVDFLNVHPKHQGKGVASHLMDEMQRRHPGAEVDHGNRTPQGKAWWDHYTQGKEVNKGRTMASSEYTKEHDWLPDGRYWAPNSPLNDQRLFNGDQLKPEVRAKILNDFYKFCIRHGYNNFADWAIVYFAGSEASKFLGPESVGNNDFDLLVGVDYEKFKASNPSYEVLNNVEIAKMLTDEMHQELNNPSFDPLGTGDHFDQTWYQNPDSYDIRSINPYAAYDVTNNKWAVKPLEVPEDWSARSIPESFWEVSEAEANLISVIGDLPPLERHQVATQVYGMIHEGRKQAFGKHSKSIFAFNNILEKYLDQRPDHPLAKLIAMKDETVDPSQDSWQPPKPDLGDYTSSLANPNAGEGVVVVLVPPRTVCEQLEQDKGEPVEEMHVTLAYMGKIGDLTAKQRRYLPEYVANWAVGQTPLKAKINGVGTFANPDQHALWFSPDIPHGNAMRESLVDYLEAHGYPIYHNHGWSSHITVKYSRWEHRFIPKTIHASWDVDSVEVWMGGKRTTVPLGRREQKEL